MGYQTIYISIVLVRWVWYMCLCMFIDLYIHGHTHTHDIFKQSRIYQSSLLFTKDHVSGVNVDISGTRLFHHTLVFVQLQNKAHSWGIVCCHVLQCLFSVSSVCLQLVSTYFFTPRKAKKKSVKPFILCISAVWMS